jgi:glycerol-3-phosphate acyltransferase PlsY
MKILFGSFRAKVWRGDVFEPTVRNVSSHEISNDNVFRIVNIAVSKI